jgi:hypothetical protein
MKEGYGMNIDLDLFDLAERCEEELLLHSQ